MAEIRVLLQAEPTGMSFVHKAQTLLTRDWSHATWRSRANILRTVDWLLNVDRARRASPQSRFTL
jgi:hypothetical protein